MVSITNEERARRLRTKSFETIAKVDAMLAKQPSPDEDVVAVPEPPFDWRGEDEMSKWRREAAETDARRAAAKLEIKAIEDEGRRRAEAHELAVVEARAKAVADNNDAVLTDALRAMSAGLNAVIDRIEAIEKRLDHAESSKGVGRRAKSSAK
jgi:hypothetical protein